MNKASKSENKTENGFHTVEYKRKVREEMSSLYNRDTELYFKEIKQAMDDYKKYRHKVAANC